VSQKSEIQEVIKEYEKKNKGKYNLNIGQYHKFLSLCELADILCDEFEIEEVDIQVEPSSGFGTVCLEADEVVFENGRRHEFFRLIQSSDYLRFAKSKNGAIEIHFGVKELWLRCE